MSTRALPFSAIAFDLGGVLVNVDHQNFCRRLAAAAGRMPQEVYAAVFQTPLEQDYDTGRISSEEFHRRVLNHFRLKMPFSLFGQMWAEVFDSLQDMETVVAHLSRRYPLYLLSNTNELHFLYIQENFPSLLSHFRSFILSYRVGSRKPEPLIYQALIRESGLPPEQILYTDDREDFVAAARSQGLAAWHFTSPGNFKEQLSLNGLW
ncbi:MAG: HAD family phosphatase [Deltaproteobacteria bacterium]|nr:HAD family phosphatase [Deltaproteobacteria bacterium]